MRQPKFSLKYFTLFMILPFTMLCLTQPLRVAGQIKNLSKLPNLSQDVEKAKKYPSIPMPDSYPKDLVQLFDEQVDARSYVVVDSQTNRILAQRQANVPYPIASMSKIIPTYLVFKAIDEGKLTLETEIEAPKEITDVLSNNYELSSANLIGGQKYSVKDLLYGVIMMSGNDATSVLMWHLYGSEQGGVEAIKDQLDEWGITDYRFFTNSGLPNSFLPEEWWAPGSSANDENQMSAQDVALVAQHVSEDYPEILQIASTIEYLFKADTEFEQVFYTTNLLLTGQSEERQGITGLKSGSTDAAGNNFVATGTEEGRELVTVAMGVFPNADGSVTTPYADINHLLNGLATHPDLYQDEKLPTNKKPSLAERQAEEASIQASINESIVEAAKKDETPGEEVKEFENRRDNPITDFLGQFFK